MLKKKLIQLYSHEKITFCCVTPLFFLLKDVDYTCMASKTAWYACEYIMNKDNAMSNCTN